jgi:hypothetical protein
MSDDETPPTCAEWHGRGYDWDELAMAAEKVASCYHDAPKKSRTHEERVDEFETLMHERLSDSDRDILDEYIDDYK